MQLMERDIKLIRDVALSHVLSRDQIMALGYFGSITRTNTRLRSLEKLHLIRRLDTPFFGQSLYMAGAEAEEVAGTRIAPLLRNRASSPRFVQHALCVTNARIALLKQGATAWRFEQQLRTAFTYRDRSYEVRPDGLAHLHDRLIALEIDMGHVPLAKFKEKLKGFEAFVRTGECLRQWHMPSFTLHAITTGARRADRLQTLIPSDASFEYRCWTFDQYGLPRVGGWS